MPDFTTNRLILSPWPAHEIEFFWQLNTHPQVRQYLWDDQTISFEAAKDILTQNKQLFTKQQFGLWQIQSKQKMKILGYIGLWFFFEEPQPQLLYALHPDHWGQGYAVEAGQAILAYTWKTLGFEYLTAATDQVHRASQKVMERLGMSFLARRVEGDTTTVFYQIVAPSSEPLTNN